LDQPGDQEKHEKHHAGFVELIHEAAELTGDPWLKAADLFYGDPGPSCGGARGTGRRKAARRANVALFFLPGLDSEDPGGAIVTRPAVKEFWRGRYQRLSGTRHAKGGEGVCMISGKLAPSP